MVQVESGKDRGFGQLRGIKAGLSYIGILLDTQNLIISLPGEAR